MDKKNEFTLDAYQELLKTALTSGYSFLAFHDPERFGIDKVCLLRHDIDADLGAAGRWCIKGLTKKGMTV